jgi:hypothetical protein
MQRDNRNKSIESRSSRIVGFAFKIIYNGYYSLMKV